MIQTSQSPSTAFVDEVAASVRAALDELDRHESELVAAGASSVAETPSALGRLEIDLAGWQRHLAEMAENVRTAHDELADLDSVLKRSLNAITATRKHLQSAWRQAADGSQS